MDRGTGLTRGPEVPRKGPCPGDSSGCHHASPPLPLHPLPPLSSSRARDAAPPSQTRFLQILFNGQSSDMQRALQSGTRSPPHPAKHSLTHPLLDSSGPGEQGGGSVPHPGDAPLGFPKQPRARPSPLQPGSMVARQIGRSELPGWGGVRPGEGCLRSCRRAKPTLSHNL